MANVIYRSTACLATATAIALALPPVGDRLERVTQGIAEYRPLDDTSGRLVERAIRQSVYVTNDGEALFSLITEVALRLVKLSKPLESDFAGVVDKEFWNLLK